MPLVSTPGFDISTLTPCGVLDLAFAIAEEAQERYAEFARQLSAHHTREAASFFGVMAETEAERTEALRHRRRQSFEDVPPAVPPIACVGLAPDYDEVRAFMSLRQAVTVALAAEQRVAALLDAAIQGAEDSDARALLCELRDDESRLQSLLRADLEALPPDREADLEDTGDEPVAQ